MNYIVYKLSSIKVTYFSFLHNFNYVLQWNWVSLKTETLHLSYFIMECYIGKEKYNSLIKFASHRCQVERIKLSQIEEWTILELGKKVLFSSICWHHILEFLDIFSFGKELLYRVIGLPFRIRDRERRLPWINILNFLSLNLFLIAAVTNYHKRSSLKQHKLISYSTGTQKSEMDFTGVSPVLTGLYSYGGFRENLFSSVFQLLEATCILLWPLPLLQDSNITNFSVILIFCLLLPCLKDPCYHIASTQMFQKSLF